MHQFRGHHDLHLLRGRRGHVRSHHPYRWVVSLPPPTSLSIFLSNYVSTLTGVCSEVGNIPIFVGYHNIKLEVGPCPGHFISDTASGYFSTSRVIIEEVPLGEWVVREQQLCFQSYSLLLSYSFICVCSSSCFSLMLNTQSFMLIFDLIYYCM